MPPFGGEALLIAAQSGRALAQAARRAGLRPLVLDLFGDADTLELAEHHRTAPGRFGAPLADAAILDRLDELAGLSRTAPIGIVLGSGFEGAIDLMAGIASRHRMLGATPEAVTALKDPLGFAALCARLSIPHPPVTREPVTDRAGWLLKRAGGSGGSHIRVAGAGRAPPGAYFQARVAGRAHALAFLADGRRLEPLGFTEQWSAPSRLRPHRYGGALERGLAEPALLSPALRAAIIAAAARLVEAIGLRGLASADVLVEGEDWWLTEVNPRPGATLDVLDRRPTPLLVAHIEASLGRLSRVGAPPSDAAAAEICYAATNYAPVPPIRWPDFVRDRPRAGSSVAEGAPLCTLIADGPESVAVRRILRERANTLGALLRP
jgi:predicted ATP-grasp superfamily ATP-dependent carboligase